MAYYAPFYRPYYDQMQPTQAINQFNQPMTQTMPQPMQTAPQPMPSQSSNGLIWVQGESGAKSYLVAPGATVMLMDSEGERFFLKSADASGMPLPLRVFEYKERTEAAQQAPELPVMAEKVDFDKFVTREEFERTIANITAQTAPKKSANKQKEDVDNA